MNKKQIKKYLDYLGLKDYFSFKPINCELCGFSKNDIIKNIISWNNNKFGYHPISVCKNCGFVFQKYRSSKKFYKKFYEEFYRKKIYKNLSPSKEFLSDQKKRGEKIFKYIRNMLPKKGTVLDVGSSVGLMLLPYKNMGWKIIGNDPDLTFVEFGKKKYNLPIECIQSEDMKLKQNSLDLIIIAGSLEHCYDPNKVLQICANAAKKNSLLILEGRGEPRATSKYYFNHNHHRYFSLNTLELMMIKHGWKPLITTMYPISGPTREGGTWSIGKLSKKLSKSKFQELIKNGKKESAISVKEKYRYYDLINQNLNPMRGDYRFVKKNEKNY